MGQGTKSGRTNKIWQLALLAAFQLIAERVSGAPPIEALQRSVQQRWGPYSGGGQTTFPKRGDVDPGAYPSDGFYGSDLDDPTKLNALLDALENQVFGGLATRYVTFDAASFTGTRWGLKGNEWGTTTWVPWAEKTVAALCARPSALLPADERVALLKAALKRCVVTVQDNPGPYQNYVLINGVTLRAADGTTCGAANGPATSAWNSHGFRRQDIIQYFNVCALAGASNYPQGGGGGYPSYNETSWSSTATRGYFEAGDASGSVIYFGLLDPGSTHADPLCPTPINDSYQPIDRKTARGTTVSKWIGYCDDYPGPPLSFSCGSDWWRMNAHVAMFVGSFQDDWQDQDCSSCEGEDARCATPGLDSLAFRLGLGRSDFGRKRDELSLRANTLGRGFCSLGSVKIQAGPGGTLAKDSTTGLPVQFSNASCVVNFAIVTPESSFEIREFPRSAISGPQDATTKVYPVSGNPARRVVVENLPSVANPLVPDWNKVRITVWSGSTAVQTNLWIYDPATGGWVFDRENGQAREVLTPTWNSGHTQRTERRQLYDAANNLVSVTNETFQVYAWGEELVQRVRDPDGAALTETWDYYAVYDSGYNVGRYGRLRLHVEPSGRWEWFDYDALGRETRRISQHLGSVFSEPLDGNVHRMVETTYATTSVPRRQRTDTTLGVLTRRSWTYFVDASETREILAANATSSWDDPANLVTSTLTWTVGDCSGRVKSIRRPDGTLETFDYTYSSDGSTLTTTRTVGSPSEGAVADGQRTVTVVNQADQETVVQTYDVAGTPSRLLASRAVTLADDFGRPMTWSFDDGTTERISYGCCAMESRTDREGTTTSYGYDSLARRITRETNGAGITQASAYDAASRLIERSRTGTNGTRIVQETSLYDLAGRRTSSTDALGRVTKFDETRSPGEPRITTRTTTFAYGTSDAASRIERIHSDGRLESVMGSAERPRRYEYGATAPTGPGAPFGTWVKEIRLGAQGAAMEWTTTYTNLLGQEHFWMNADGSSRTRKFNAKGQLWKETDEDGVTTLYDYNARGERDTVAVDMDRNGAIADAGLDRVVRVQRSVGAATTDTSLTVLIETTTVLPTDNSASAAVVRRVERTPNGHREWRWDYGMTSDRLTTMVRTGYGTGKIDVYVTRPDGTWTLESLLHGGRLERREHHAAGGTLLAAENFFYDAHGRLISYEQTRTGLTAYDYSSADELTSVDRPAPNGLREVTQTLYDARGRPWKTIWPDAAETATYYFPNGEVASVQGARVTPAFYSYDPQGRRQTMTLTGSAGLATTIWAYDPVTGRLSAKTDTIGKSVGYQWTAAGRLRKRTGARGAQATVSTFNTAGEPETITYTGDAELTPEVTLQYDRLGRVRQEQSSVAGTHALAWRLDGQLEQETWTGGAYGADSVSLVRSFDPKGRRYQLDLKRGSAIILSQSWAYDTGTGRLASASQDAATVAYGYTANSVASLVESLTFAGGGISRASTAKTYDVQDRPAQWTHALAGGGGGSPLAAFGYRLDAAGQRERVTLEDGTRWEYVYDALGQVVQARRRNVGDGSAVPGYDFGFHFDTAGNRYSATVNGRQSSYVPDLLNRYTQRTNPGFLDVLGTASAQASVSVNDGQGHFFAAQRQGERFWKALPADNSQGGRMQPVNVVAVRNHAGPGGADLVAQSGASLWLPPATETYAHDDDGNLLSDGRWLYTWDAENRLVKLENRSSAGESKVWLPEEGQMVEGNAGGEQFFFTYDVQGRRVQKQRKIRNQKTGDWEEAGTTRYVWDGWLLVAELDENNQLKRSNLWGLDLSNTPQGAGGVGGLLLTTDHAPTTSQSHFACSDASGNVCALIDAQTGQPSARYAYGPFGEPLEATGPAAASNPWRFSTKYDDGTGLLYYGYRYYHPGTGRWSSRDPIEEEGGLNLYGFVNNNPANIIDAVGLRSIDVNIGFDGSGSFKDPSLRRRIWDNVEGLKRALKVCCDEWKLMCGVDVRVHFDWTRRQAPNFYEVDNDKRLPNLQNINTGFPGVRVLFTNTPVMFGETPRGQIANNGIIMFNAGKNNRGDTFAHEMGHYIGYVGDDRTLPNPFVHSMLRSNLMYGGYGNLVGPYRDRDPDAKPDCQWCRRMSNIYE